MVSSKGKPTDPKLREQLKNKIKNEGNKDGSGKGQWAAWKATKLSQAYEAEGGDYENQPGSKNEPKSGAPQPKSENKKTAETKSKSKSTTENKSE
ncbi:hypothetical protein TREMEDRAFT_20174, partial [Tremella mesenterica DSM 1558]|uniref:uncharacterized protein n=1 Tax=Tremella mesenterica (strain ATCC 24925 / CBS 8224 / DSM 1558 / NBRC 9311 / NRRL Y-6157 / RJB 2259-6 / UBC 559-6) TaxID=578456 RepID=UPI0003F4917A